MIHVKIICDTGKSWSTDINGDLQSATQYFLGKVFTFENDSGVETRHTVTEVLEQK